MPLLIDQQPALLDGDVLELERRECLVDPLLGVAVLDDRVGRQLRCGRNLEVDLHRVGLGRDEYALPATVKPSMLSAGGDVHGLAEALGSALGEPRTRKTQSDNGREFGLIHS